MRRTKPVSWFSPPPPWPPEYIVIKLYSAPWPIQHCIIWFQDIRLSYCINNIGFAWRTDELSKAIRWSGLSATDTWTEVWLSPLLFQSLSALNNFLAINILRKCNFVNYLRKCNFVLAGKCLSLMQLDLSQVLKILLVPHQQNLPASGKWKWSIKSGKWNEPNLLLDQGQLNLIKMWKVNC